LNPEGNHRVEKQDLSRSTAIFSERIVS